MNGSLDVDSAIANLYDVAPLSQSTSSGEITIWSTHIFDVRLGGNPQSANLLLSVNDGLLWEGTAQGSSVQVSIPTKYVDDTGTQDFDTVRVIATAENLPKPKKS